MVRVAGIWRLTGHQHDYPAGLSYYCMPGAVSRDIPRTIYKAHDKTR